AYANKFKEMAGSRADLEKIVGGPVASFAYPYGFHDEGTRAVVAEVFESAITCEEGMNSLSTDPCRLRRTMIQPKDTLVDLAWRVSIGRSPIERLRSRLAAVRHRFRS